MIVLVFPCVQVLCQVLVDLEVYPVSHYEVVHGHSQQVLHRNLLRQVVVVAKHSVVGLSGVDAGSLLLNLVHSIPAMV
jgi:hypothetical protein